MLVFTDTWIKSVALAFKTGAAAPDLTPGTIDLFQNDIIPTRQTVVGDLTVCDFTGYAQGAINPTGPFNDAVNGPYLQSALQAFAVDAAPTITNTAFGYFLRDMAGVLIGVERFPNPIPMIAPLAQCSFVTQLRIRQY